MQHKRVARVALGGFALFAVATAASDWPRFRGTNGSGISPEKTIPVSWTQKEGVLWKTAIPGFGNSSPIVCNGHVFLQTASADGKERALVCVDATTGKVVWSRQIPGEHARAHRLNSLASATPASDGQRVYAAFWDGRDVTIHAFDMDGKPLWKRNLGAFKSQHGPGTSPIVHRNRLYFANDQDDDATLYCLDSRTGETAWKKARRAFRASYATPVISERRDGGKDLIVASTAGITCYDPETGREIWDWTWNFDGSPLRCVGSPQISDDLILVSAGDGDGTRSAAAVRMGGSGNVTVSHLVWQSDKRWLPYVPSAIVHDGHLYFVNDKGFACCVAATTGRQIWMERLANCDFLASPVLINEKVYAFGDDGKCHVFAAATKYRPLGTSDIGERVKASPAVADGKLFVRGESHLFCIGSK
jgi:outer membrane protein assembly factor BamB